METSLVYRSDEKQLCIGVKEKLVSNNVHLKFTGLLNTVRGTWEHQLNAGWLMKLPKKAGQRVAARRRSAKNQILCGPFATFDSQSKDVDMGLTLRIRQVLDDTGDFWINAKAHTFVNSAKLQPSIAGVVQFNRVLRSITSNQDLKVTLELNANADVRGNSSQGAAIVIRENNWGVRLEKTNFSLMYDL